MSKKYFVCANSGKGFVNFFSESLENMQKIYIIKGGPGSGKSTLMKRIAKKYEDEGLNIDCIMCSSDPDSLDGVIINDYRIAIVDGTMPHIIEAFLPGAVEEYINAGNIWDISILENNKEEITFLNNNIKKDYEKAYEYLKDAKRLHDELEEYYKNASNFEKMDIIFNEIIAKIDEKINK
jgi:predicted PilT family ATPase